MAFFVGLAGFHLLAMVVALVVHGRYAGPTPLALPDLGPWVLVVFVPHLMMVLGPWYGARRWGGGFGVEFRLVPTLADLRSGVFYGVIALGVGLTLNLVSSFVYGAERMPSNPLEEMAEGLGDNRAWLILLALIVVLVVPIAEELLVRGSLWNALAHYRIPSWAIVVVTAAVFAYLHEEHIRTIALFGQGLALGAARLATGRVAASAVAHAVNNFAPALILVLGA